MVMDELQLREQLGKLTELAESITKKVRTENRAASPAEQRQLEGHARVSPLPVSRRTNRISHTDRFWDRRSRGTRRSPERP